MFFRALNWVMLIHISRLGKVLCVNIMHASNLAVYCLHELNEKVQFSSKVPFLVNFELNLVHFSKKELELN